MSRSRVAASSSRNKSNGEPPHLVEPALQLLLAEDEPIERDLLVAMLGRAGYDVVAVDNGQDALREILSGNYPLVVTDRSMPRLDGLQLCRAVRAAQLPSYVYILMLTGWDSTADAVAGLKAGADDYVSKPLRGEELIARLAAARRILSLERSLREANERIRVLTVTDPLVGTYNRRYFDDQLSAAIVHAERHSRPLALVFIDVDHFKVVNDTYGHRVGDEVLVEVGKRLLSNLRAGDWVARYGGEEFAVVLPETDAEAAIGVAERLRIAIAEQGVATSVGELAVTASFGVATSHPSMLGTPQSLVAAADAALYQSKAGGRNRTTLSRH